MDVYVRKEKSAKVINHPDFLLIITINNNGKTFERSPFHLVSVLLP